MLEEKDFSKIIDQALAEDIGAGDITSNSVIPEDATGRFAFTAREEMVICGLSLLEYIFPEVSLLAQDSDRLQADDVIAEIEGNVRDILSKERVALNFLQHLSGIATITAQYVATLANDECKILDTRKTTPGLRVLEKYAVKCGGGENHRMGLYDMVLIKDNHIQAAGGVSKAIAAGKTTGLKVEIECDTLEQVAEAVEAKPDIIMLDNFAFTDIEEAVDIIDGRAKVEVSGGVMLENVRRISKTGVDFISTSKITQAAPAMDIGLDEV